MAEDGVVVVGRGFRRGARYTPARGQQGLPRRLLAVEPGAVLREVVGGDGRARRVRDGTEWFAAWAGEELPRGVGREGGG